MLYLGYPGWAIWQKKQVVRKGIPLEFTTPLSDPQYSYRGTYLPLLLPDKLNTTTSVRAGESVYVSFGKTDAGIRPTAILRERPAEAAYVRAHVRHVADRLVFLDYPPSLRQMPLNGQEAAQLRQRYRKWMEEQGSEVPKVTVRLYFFRGKAVADQVLTVEHPR